MTFTPLEPTPSNLEQQERLGLRGLLHLPSRPNPFGVFLNGCSNPDCPCDSVQLRLLEVAETAEPVEGGVDLTVMIRGLTGTLTDPGDLPRADRILVCQAVEALPALERRAVRRQNAQRSVEENLADALMRGSDVMEGLLQSWSFHAAGGSRNPAGVDATAGRLSLDGREWFFDVLYCPNPKCDCKHFNVVGMEPRTNYPDEGTKGPPLVDRFMVQGYLSKPELNVYESSPGYRKLAIPVVQEWLAGIPNHQALFTRQYQQVREIALRSLLSEGIQTTPIVRPKKIGRNEGCPCGSGLKYKRCCGK